MLRTLKNSWLMLYVVMPGPQYLYGPETWLAIIQGVSMMQASGICFYRHDNALEIKTFGHNYKYLHTIKLQTFSHPSKQQITNYTKFIYLCIFKFLTVWYKWRVEDEMRLSLILFKLPVPRRSYCTKMLTYFICKI